MADRKLAPVQHVAPSGRLYNTTRSRNPGRPDHFSWQPVDASWWMPGYATRKEARSAANRHDLTLPSA